ncbi:MAG: VirB8/TrbF family protein [Cetobacterium sp.]
MDNKEIDYGKAKQELYDFYGSQTKRIMTYKVLALLLLLLTIISTLSAVYLSTKSTLVPYVVEVDQTGNAKSIKVASQVYIPKEVEERFFLREVVYKMRNIPRDSVLFSRNFQYISYFLSEPMLRKHENILLNEGANQLAQQLISRDANIISFNKMPRTKNTFQIKWNEVIYSAEGEELNKDNYTGIFTIKVEQPTVIEELNFNPLGIIVEDFSISKEEN